MPLLLSAHFDINEKVFELEATIVSSRNADSLLSCNQVGAFGPSVVKKIDANCQEPGKKTRNSRVVGHVGVLQKKHCNERVLAFVLDLDVLTLLRYDIPDTRLLWCEDNLYCKFANLTFDKPYCFRPISMYPPLWRQDLSIWDESGSKLTKNDIVDIVYDIAHDCISEIHLRDRWVDEKTGGVSRCFREVYQSPCLAVSHDLAHDFQNAIRLTVAKEFGVTLK
jgi:phenylalanyl-tRNA synthetase beta subunit